MRYEERKKKKREQDRQNKDRWRNGGNVRGTWEYSQFASHLVLTFTVMYKIIVQTPLYVP